MCGRTSMFIQQPEMENRFDADLADDAEYRPRYNISPGEPIEVITNDAPDTIDQFHWGLIPFWADDLQGGMINARSETVAEKRPFEKAWESRACLVLSSGFYEWKKPNGGPKQPYRIYRKDDPAFAMAGLWETWERDDETIDCVTILTTEPSELMEPIHGRMPVVLPKDAEQRWLKAGPAERAERCQPYPDNDLDADAISTRVNNPANDDPSVIEPLGHDQSGLDAF